MKVLMAPVNIAGQPILATQELRRQGVDVTLLQYTLGQGHAFGYEEDEVVNLKGRHRMEAQIETLSRCLDAGYDIFHFWMATLFGGSRYRNMYGLDLPFIKARHRRIVYRGTGFDLRIPSVHAVKNPGVTSLAEAMGLDTDEAAQRVYIDYLRQYVDLFIVQDPEMHEYMPQARIVPRAVDLDMWTPQGVTPTDRPLIVHAPSKSAVKGTDLLLAALSELKDEGLQFDLKVITGMPHQEAVEWYRRADIIVDQLLIGWYGVLTLEGLSLGKPVLVYVREDLFERFRPQIPIQNAPPGKLKEALRELVSDPRRREELAAAGPDFIRDVHDVRKVAALLRGVYEEVMDMSPQASDGHADLHHFLEQFRRLEDRETLSRLRFRARKYDELVSQLPALRYRANKYDEMREEYTRMRTALRRLEASVVDRGGEGPVHQGPVESPHLRTDLEPASDDLPHLRYKATRTSELEREVQALRYKAGEYDRLRKEVLALRYKASRYDELVHTAPRRRWLRWR